MTHKKYLFQPDKKFFKPGFFMTDENDQVVYEAPMIKQSLLTATQFNFINHLSQTSQIHQIGHTVTQSESGMLGALSINSYFKYDGQNIWDYLHSSTP